MLTGYVFAGSEVTIERPLLIEHLGQSSTAVAPGHCAQDPPITVNAGSFLRILEPSAFAGLFGRVTAIDSEAREIEAEIDIFGRMVPLQLQPEQVEAV
jgi:transcription antitermination factor NusG